MLSRNDIRLIKSLELKKFRIENRIFVAEGPKLVRDLAGSFHCQLLVATPEWTYSNPTVRADRIETVSHQELEKASLLKNPQDVIALFRMPDNRFDLEKEASDNLVISLDGIQDPGNLGTIVRISDWFGIRHIICSKDTADIYNPKSVQATMGALARVRLHYVDLQKELENLDRNIKIFGTFLDGDNIYKCKTASNGIIVMGNEGNGISPQIAELVNSRLLIPAWPQGAETSESLNVAVATAVICAEFRRRLG